MIFFNGQRVNTPQGPGRVAYQRMNPPDYRQVEAVSVVLDSRKTNFSYTGTIFTPDNLTPIEDNHAND